MSLPTKDLAHRLARSAFVALLMPSAATAAMAAPKHTHKHAWLSVEDPRDAKMAAMQAQIDEMRAQMAQVVQAKSAESDTKVAALQQQLDTVIAQLAVVKTAHSADASDIITLKAPPPASVTLPNGKPAFASADGRFTANIRAIVMFDAGKYYQ